VAQPQRRAHGEDAIYRDERKGAGTRALPQSVVAALREQRKRQAAARLAAGELWQDHGSRPGLRQQHGQAAGCLERASRLCRSV
jgi:hypothetical protein